MCWQLQVTKCMTEISFRISKQSYTSHATSFIALVNVLYHITVTYFLCNNYNTHYNVVKQRCTCEYVKKEEYRYGKNDEYRRNYNDEHFNSLDDNYEDLYKYEEL